MDRFFSFPAIHRLRSGPTTLPAFGNSKTVAGVSYSIWSMPSMRGANGDGKNQEGNTAGPACSIGAADNTAAPASWQSSHSQQNILTS